jgi:pentatricopeptide repeat protein
MFDQMPIHDTVSWNALISGYTQREQGEEAVKYYENMLRDSLPPDEITCVCILKACGCVGTDKKGKQIHAKIVNEGWLERNVLVGTALIDMYSKCGALQNAHEVFNQLHQWNIVTWNALMVGYVQHGHGGEAWSCFDRMQNQSMSPNAETFVCILRACGSIGAIRSGKCIHAGIVGDRCLERNILVGNQLIDMYGKCGALAEAIELFEQLPARDVVTWTALIAGYAQHGYDDEAINCFRLMEENGFSPNEFTFVCVLKACSSLRAVDKGEAIYHKVQKASLLEKNVLVGTSLVDMYAKHGDLTRAQEIFGQLQVKNLVTWNALISGYVQHGHYEEALEHFDQMQRQFSPNSVTFLCILKACSNMGLIEKGIEIHRKVCEEGFLRNDILIGNATVDMYGKCGAPTKAQEVFDDLPDQDVVSWNALISGYAQLGEDIIVMLLFDKMVGEGIKPDKVTFTIVLTTCSHSGLVDKGQMYFQMMQTYFDVVPTFEHYTCMVDLYSRAMQFDVAMTLIRELPAMGCLPMWTALMSACQKWGHVILGKLIFEHAIGLSEDNAGAYVCMSNIYAAAVLEDDEPVGFEGEL